jgi:hypothetical protein
MDSKKTNLVEILLAAVPRERLDAEFVSLIRDFIQQRDGLRGVAYRTGFAMLEKARPGIVERAVQKLLPQFIEALQPHYEEFDRAPKGGFARHLQARAGRAARGIWSLLPTGAWKAPANRPAGPTSGSAAAPKPRSSAWCRRLAR